MDPSGHGVHPPFADDIAPETSDGTIRAVFTIDDTTYRIDRPLDTFQQFDVAMRVLPMLPGIGAIMRGRRDGMIDGLIGVLQASEPLTEALAGIDREAREQLIVTLLSVVSKALTSSQAGGAQAEAAPVTGGSAILGWAALVHDGQLMNAFMPLAITVRIMARVVQDNLMNFFGDRLLAGVQAAVLDSMVSTCSTATTS